MGIIILASIVSAFISATITYSVTKYFHTNKIAASKSGDDHVLDLRLNQEFKKGQEAGRSEELEKFTLTYEPFAEIVEEYFGLKKSSTLGYEMQIHYSGFPIGQKTRYITHQNIEYDEKKVDALLNGEIASTINSIVNFVSARGIGTKTLPRRTKRGKA